MGAYARAVMRPPAPAPSHLLSVIVGEYREMPGMRLTRVQFRRLWNLDASQCEVLVGELIARGELSQGRDGRLGRPSDAM
jgi:hypothetical protein